TYGLYKLREILKETMAADEEYQREKWTRFGNEAEKLEISVIRNQRVLRTRIDKMALRKQVQSQKLQLSLKAPDFPIPLRAHTVWEGMMVKLSCTVQGCPPPKPCFSCELFPSVFPFTTNFFIISFPFIHTLTILPLNLFLLSLVALELQQEAQFDTSYPPTWVKEGDSLTLQCTFTSALLPFQQDVSWFRDGKYCKGEVIRTLFLLDKVSTITLRAAHKEHEGVYTARLTTWDGIQEHNAYVYVKDASSAVLGGPASPLAVQVSDVNKDYVFLTWQPPSADGASPGEWVRCNVHMQKMCHYAVFGLKEGTMYQFRVHAVNKAGAGRPSKATEPILTADPLEHTRTMGRTITITKDELEGQVKAPFPPTNVHACEVSDTYVVLSWAEPEPRGREPLTFYVERSLAGKNSWEMASLDMVVNSPRFPVFDLVKGKQYCFRVRSVNKYGVSDPSEPSALISLGKPQAVPAPPHSVLAIRDTDTSVLLQWKEPKDKDDILGYYLYYSEAGKQDWKTVNNKPTTKTRFTVHGLKTQEEYVFRVKSVSRAGNSSYSDESQPIMVKSAIYVPSAPSAIALLLCTGSEMVLGWRAPSCNGGDPVRGYYLDKREKGMKVWREVNVKPVKERQFKVSDFLNFYQFRVFAANVVGIGKPSEASEAFLCEKWTMPEPGCPYDLEVREVRNNSLVLLWAAPLYEGRSPVTGYLLEVSQGDQSDDWAALTDGAICDTRYKVSGLQQGQTYRFRVSAVNEAGVSCASLPTDSITAMTKPGTKNIEIGVDDDGFIFLGYEATEMNDESKFLWNKNYTEPIGAGRVRAETKKNRKVPGLISQKIYFKPKLQTTIVFDTGGSISTWIVTPSAFPLPVIALKSGWQVEVSEKGSVRLWLQTESLSNAAELRLIFNDREISSTPHRKINFDKAKGLVEILFDQLSPEDKGSYTAQLRDGRAKNQFTLVFVDQNKPKQQKDDCVLFHSVLLYRCCISLLTQVTNTNKDTSLKWFKEGTAVTQFVYDQSSGVSTLTIPQVRKKEFSPVLFSDKSPGMRESAFISSSWCREQKGDKHSDRQLIFIGLSRDKFYFEILPDPGLSAALSASPLRIQSTAEGFKLYCSLKYYISFLKTSWQFKIDQEGRARPGSSMQNVWVEIVNPTESDKGKYTLEMFDGKETHKRFLDLTEKVFADIMVEHQRLKVIVGLFSFVSERAKVTKGLPDVVAIMEGKSLCLTCFIDGEPSPEIFWLRNDREIVDQTHFTITKEPKCSTITVHNVRMDDSGKYSIFVRNQYGSETVDVTVSVYKYGEKPPANAVEMG
uniref:Myomesin 3 n=1 Tax=Stegastes partitus TaxID=144197 RepID=A0A3B5BB06_9TELE